THDPLLRSWVESANAQGHDFPIQNLPIGMFATADDATARPGIAIGDEVLDIAACLEQGLFNGMALTAARLASRSSLNAFMAAGKDHSGALRHAVSDILSEKRAREMKVAQPHRPVLVPASTVKMLLACEIRNYTDFL